jgi:hypothetical protein
MPLKSDGWTERVKFGKLDLPVHIYDPDIKPEPYVS